MSNLVPRIEITHDRDEVEELLIGAGYIIEAASLRQSFALTVLYNPSDEQLIWLTDLFDRWGINYDVISSA